MKIIKKADKFLEHFHVKETEIKAEVHDKKEMVPFDKHVTVIIPLGLPGVGKSTLHAEVLDRYFKTNKEMEYTMISNDEMRNQLVEDY